MPLSERFCVFRKNAHHLFTKIRVVDLLFDGRIEKIVQLVDFSQIILYIIHISVRFNNKNILAEGLTGILSNLILRDYIKLS